jgi:hypothetical protein
LSGSRRLAALVLVAGLLAAGAALAAPAEDRILPADQYTSEKARQLAGAHHAALRELNAGIYHCMPWVEVMRHSIGFFRPKHAGQDDRYLSIRIYIEQDPSVQFATLRAEDRASAMFSRYVGHLLRRMTRDRALAADARLDGFTVILEWLKQAPRAGGQPIHETIAAFVPRSGARDYLAGRIPIGQVAEGAKVFGWDGETALGALKLTAWDDHFVATYRVANYQLEPGVTCG